MQERYFLNQITKRKIMYLQFIPIIQTKSNRVYGEKLLKLYTNVRFTNNNCPPISPFFISRKWKTSKLGDRQAILIQKGTSAFGKITGPCSRKIQSNLKFNLTEGKKRTKSPFSSELVCIRSVKSLKRISKINASEKKKGEQKKTDGNCNVELMLGWIFKVNEKTLIT